MEIEENYKQFLDLFSLEFLNKSEGAEYSTQLKLIFKDTFHLFCIFSLFSFSFAISIDFIQVGAFLTQKGWLIIVVFLIIGLVLFISYRKGYKFFLQIFALFLVGCSFLYIFYWIAAFHNIVPKLFQGIFESSSVLIVSGMFIQWTKSLAWHFHFRWWISLISMIIMDIIIIFLIVVIPNTKINDLLWNLSMIAMILILNTFANQMVERKEKTHFHQKFLNWSQLENIKKLLNETIPTAIVIISGVEGVFKSLFHNIAAERLLIKGSQSASSSINNIIESEESINQFANSEILGNALSIIIEDHYDSKQSSGQTTEDVIKEDAESTLEYYLKKHLTLKKTMPVSGFINIHTTEKEVKKLWLDIKISKIIWEGSPAFMLCLNDIGNIKDVEEYKNQLLASVSHNLRTPLTNIFGNLDCAIGKTKNDKPMKQCLKSTLFSSQILYYAISDLLDFSQHGLGKLKIESKKIKISDLLEKIIKINKQQAKLKSINLYLETNNVDGSMILETDSNRVQQILFNLLSNAIRQTSKGSVKLKLNLKSLILKERVASKVNMFLSEPNLNQQIYVVKFVVQDTGIGFSKDEISKIFNPNSSNPSNDFIFGLPGISFGLNVSNILAKKLSFNSSGLKVKSEKGAGSKFSFYLKIEKSLNNLHFQSNFSPKKSNLLRNEYFDETSINAGIFDKNAYAESKELPSEKKEKIKEIQTNLAEKKVLIVDDDIFCNNVVSLQLESSEVKKSNIKTANNGKEALEIVKDNALKKWFFDLIIMDCDMPLMNGFEASLVIHGMVKKFEIPQVPILALTANVATSNEEQCKKAEMHYQLSKPVSKIDFQKKVEEIFKKASEKFEQKA